MAGQFKEQAADGWIEVQSADVKDFTLAGEISPALYQALEMVQETTPAARGRGSIKVPGVVNVKPIRDDERWQLRLLVPATWDDSRSVHAVARFIVRLVHAQARIARRQRRPQRSIS